MLGVHKGCKIPPGCCEVILVSHSHYVLVHVPHCRVIVPRQGLALFPVAITVLAGSILQMAGITLENEWAHQIKPALAFSGVPEAATVKLFSLAGVLDGCEVCVGGFHSFTSAVLRS